MQRSSLYAKEDRPSLLPRADATIDIPFLVILQVGYFKLTHGKRLFKMSPIHHHFEMCGWKEEKIVLTFAAVSAIMCLIAWFGIPKPFF